jgi:phosphoribosylaminoimidazole-succinocarboxamide synthase
MLIPIILGSSKDLKHGTLISEGLKKYGLDTIIRVCSAHKYPTRVLDLINKYNNDGTVPVMVTIAGKSNALSALIDGSVDIPIISCPPLNNDTMYDLYSSVSMPTEIAPMVVLKPNNAVIAVLKICGLIEPKYRLAVHGIHKTNRDILRIDDIKEKYNHIVVTKPEENIDCLGGLIRNGKIRDIYTINNNDNQLGMVATERLSSFDKVLTTIPMKSMVLNKVSAWWFNQTKHFIPNHLVDSNYNDLSIVEKCTVFPIEFVMRSYMTGSTKTSIWQNYLKGSRHYCGHSLRDGYKKNDKLDQILLTPTTKSDISDELISEKEILEQNIMSEEHWNICKEYAIKLFEFGQRVADKRGLILVDTKYEFGLTDDGRVLLIDEVHTPDSSRFWFKHSYQERIANRKEPENLDKEIIRRWVKENYQDPYTADNITIPDDLRDKLSKVYLQFYELITGSELV